MATKRKATRGRPKSDEGPRQTISIRVSDEERKALKARAEDLGIPETTVARMLLRRALGLSQGEL